MKILITGGHLAPALAVIEEINKQSDIVFVGRKYDFADKKTFSLEYQEVTKKNIPFYDLQTGRFTRLLNINFFINTLKIPYGLYQSLKILLSEKPEAILSFGGYLGFPVCLAGFMLGIPIFIHEQTSKPGITNRLTGFLAKKIFISFPETKKYFPGSKVIVSGNPVRKTVLTVDKKPFKFKKTRPVIYITGGSLGSESINAKIEQVLPQLLSKYLLIHQTGNLKETENIKKESYYVRKHFFAKDLGSIYSTADLVIGRAGANTVFELIAWEKPSILIPLPWSANQEQLKHARIMQNSGIAEIFNQGEDPQQLTSLVEKILDNYAYYKKNFKKVKLLYKENAAKFIVEKILSSLNN